MNIKSFLNRGKYLEDIILFKLEQEFPNLNRCGNKKELFEIASKRLNISVPTLYTWSKGILPKKPIQEELLRKEFGIVIGYTTTKEARKDDDHEVIFLCR